MVTWIIVNSAILTMNYKVILSYSNRAIFSKSSNSSNSSSGNNSSTSRKCDSLINIHKVVFGPPLLHTLDRIVGWW